MKINTHNTVKVVSVLLCAVVFTISLCEPAYAASIAAYDPYDYVGDITVMGDEKKVTFDFTGVPWNMAIWENPGSIKTMHFGFSGETYQFRAQNDDSTNIASRIFLFGHERYEGQSAVNNGVLYIGDIMPGASVDIGMTFGLKVTRVSLETTHQPLKVFFNYGFFMYDKDGKYLGSQLGYASSIEYPAGVTDTVVHNPSYQYTFSADVQYICPFISWSATDEGGIKEWLFEFTPSKFICSTNINMIYEDSITMDRIQNKLDDLNDGIQDANDKLDDTNNKLDDIISGGDAADAVKPDNDKISDSTDKMDSAMNDMDNASEDLPTTPTSFDDIIDDAVIDKALSNGAVLFNWNASGLVNMFPPLGLSCGLSVLFYVIFGKKG